jgi:small subunit ribosomal protein S4e
VEKMVKNHLKRLASPRTWRIERKSNVFVTKPLPGPHNRSTSVPFTVFFKDMARLGTTTRDAKYVLFNKTVLINGSRLKDHRRPVGFMDVVTITDIDKHYRIVINKQGKLISKEVSKDETAVIFKIKDKTLIKGGKIQLNLMNGSNLLVDKDDYKTGDSITFKEKKVQQHFKLTKGAFIYLMGGKHKGDQGIVEDIKDEKIIFKNKDNETIETLKRYAFVIGDKKPSITI